VATVTDTRGRYVADLAADDFAVYEDGQPQQISHFEYSQDLPVSVGVVLDTSGSMERRIRTAADAVERFVRTIHEDDDIFLMTFSGSPELRQDFTDDRNRLATVLRRLNVGGGTALYDAMEDSLRKVKRGKHQKKAILLITDGEDTASSATFDDANRAIREAELLVYSLGIAASSSALSERIPVGTGGPAGLPFPIPGIPGGRGTRTPASSGDTVDMNVLNSFADASGGRSWLISGTWTEGRGNKIEQALDEIALELRNQYTIGYYPPHSPKDGKWHRIEIRAKDSRYRVRARKDYFGG
jgi:Ca-activated chloride channel family protein